MWSDATSGGVAGLAQAKVAATTAEQAQAQALAGQAQAQQMLRLGEDACDWVHSPRHWRWKLLVWLELH